jgi:P-type E1-E2 ATPase
MYRFLAVVVVATPCPLLLAIPTAIIGAISVAARRAIIIKNPMVLEQIDSCQTLIFDKTGTLTYGRPTLTEIICAEGFERQDVLRLAASLEHYSKHPLAGAIVGEAEKQETKILGVTELSEAPGEGLRGTVEGHTMRITGRKQAEEVRAVLPVMSSGLECEVFIDERYAATMRFHDAPRSDSRLFIQHLKPRHGVRKVMLVSGDRGSEVQYLANSVGISEVCAGKSPEEKVTIVKQETAKAKTLFVGDGINDAPALAAATVGVAFGSQNDIITEAADAVILEPSLGKVDELMHIGRRMRRIALQSALGGMLASTVGMIADRDGLLAADWRSDRAGVHRLIRSAKRRAGGAADRRFAGLLRPHLNNRPVDVVMYLVSKSRCAWQPNHDPDRPRKSIESRLLRIAISSSSSHLGGGSPA